MKQSLKTLLALTLCTLTLTACQTTDNANNNLYQEKAEQAISPTTAPTDSGKPKQQSPFDSMIGFRGDEPSLMDKAIAVLTD
ncbi:MAG: hypothetical protein LBL41_02890, partial [Bifidobacteriaceae bacterium]|nr:hypothetical protein [Bifidobacteriaceae bacterium]